MFIKHGVMVIGIHNNNVTRDNDNNNLAIFTVISGAL